jgi:uncharacterized protein
VTHPHAEMLRRAYEAYAKSDFTTAMSAFDHDIVWHVTGRNPLAGDYEGTEQVEGFFRKAFELYGGTFRMEIHDILANDDHAVVLVRATGQRAGKTLDAALCHVWHVADGKATEFWELRVDPVGDEEFWS